MIREIIYGEGRKGPLSARFTPAGTARAPVVVALHGGAWRAGGPARYDGIAAQIAANGMSVLSIAYTLVDGTPETRFPAQMNDLASALSFLAGNADSLGIDVERLGLMGDSAGATLVALQSQGRGAVADQPAIRAMVGIYGVYDLLAQFEHDLLHRSDDQITEALLGKSALSDRRIYQEASPLSYAVRREPSPSSLIVWGMEDDVVECRTQSEAFLSALKRAGQKARGLPVPGAGHFWISESLDTPYGHAAFAVPRIIDFLKSSL